MYCLRCGRDTTGDHIFCDSCQQDMALYPVRPGTHVHLPKPKDPLPAKKRSKKKRPATPEEQIVQLRKSLRRTRAVLAAAVLLLALAGGLLVYEAEMIDSNIGKNYAVDTTMNTD